MPNPFNDREFNGVLVRDWVDADHGTVMQPTTDGGRMSARCQECQTYGDESNPLTEIAVDEGEGIYECENCMEAEWGMYGGCAIDPYYGVPIAASADLVAE